MVNYREKYLKYKLKYLNLKNKKSMGGARLVGAGKKGAKGNRHNKAFFYFEYSF